jgi:hypothetical protein
MRPTGRRLARWGYSKLSPHRAWLERRVLEKSDITMPER